MWCGVVWRGVVVFNTHLYTRYWGTPIPMVYCEGKEGESGCGLVPVPEEQLPVILPHDIHISAKGGSPLARHTHWLHTTCPWYCLFFLNALFSLRVSLFIF